jgi:hypothetical protein
MAPSSDREKLELMDSLLKYFRDRSDLSSIHPASPGVRSWQTLCTIRDEYQARVREKRDLTGGN